MSKKVLTDYHKQFIAENYRTLGPQGCADALGVKYGTVYAYAQSHGIKCKSFAAEQISFMQEHRYDMTAALVAEKIGLTERQVRGWYNNHMPKKIRVFNDRYFQNIDSQEKAYWLGFIFADGYITSHSCGVSDASSSTRITYESLGWNFSVKMNIILSVLGMLLAVCIKFIRRSPINLFVIIECHRIHTRVSLEYIPKIL